MLAQLVGLSGGHVKGIASSRAPWRCLLLVSGSILHEQARCSDRAGPPYCCWSRVATTSGSVNVNVKPTRTWLFTQILAWSSMNFRDSRHVGPGGRRPVGSSTCRSRRETAADEQRSAKAARRADLAVQRRPSFNTPAGAAGRFASPGARSSGRRSIGTRPPSQPLRSPRPAGASARKRRW